MKPLAAFAGAACLAGCVIVDADTDIGSELRARDAEPLMAVTVDSERIIVRVNSNGCTKKEDLSVDVDSVGSKHRAYSLTIEREREDPCRALMREGVEIEFTRSELGVGRDADLFVRNPFSG